MHRLEVGDKGGEEEEEGGGGGGRMLGFSFILSYLVCASCFNLSRMVSSGSFRLVGGSSRVWMGRRFLVQGNQHAILVSTTK